MHIANYTDNATLNIVQVLQEEYQILPNGVTRARGVPLSEKMKAGEAWSDAVLRAVKEELGSVLPFEPEVSTVYLTNAFCLLLSWLTVYSLCVHGLKQLTSHVLLPGSLRTNPASVLGK